MILWVQNEKPSPAREKLGDLDTNNEPQLIFQAPELAAIFAHEQFINCSNGDISDQNWNLELFKR